MTRREIGAQIEEVEADIATFRGPLTADLATCGGVSASGAHGGRRRVFVRGIAC